MAKKILIYISLTILLCLSAFYVQSIRAFKKFPVKETKILNFPAALGSYESQEVKLEKKVYEILNTQTIFFRRYSKDKEPPVWFLIVYGESDRQSFHPPEYCYLGGADTELLGKEIETFDLEEDRVEANKLLLKTSGYKQLVYYWYTAGKNMTPNYYRQQLYFVLEQIKRKKIGGTLIRISTVVTGTETEIEARQRITDFLNLALPEIKKIL